MKPEKIRHSKGQCNSDLKKALMDCYPQPKLAEYGELLFTRIAMGTGPNATSNSTERTISYRDFFKLRGYGSCAPKSRHGYYTDRASLELGIALGACTPKDAAVASMV